MFAVTLGKGFQMTFANGWTVSVQWGANNYCKNRSHDLDACVAEMRGEALSAESPDAEIAAWDKDGTWFDFGSDTVKGWCSPDHVAFFIAGVAMGLCDSSPEQMRAGVRSKE
jgi:hypothetical protein